ncbi:hypothetical protein E2C01_072514 [Portunus trituberculatus]|uniref:Uncharacterized protein n=1 Tax=Portunus trituberculatus TaxID=210409 RepID=A0A5B7HY95_PORTR|nr:hypothetical protein [Portunus trituberculatus]
MSPHLPKSILSHQSVASQLIWWGVEAAAKVGQVKRWVGGQAGGLLQGRHALPPAHSFPQYFVHSHNMCCLASTPFSSSLHRLTRLTSI